jgi:hypothetical protein
MTLYDFKLLDLNDQAQATWDNGVLLGYREESVKHMVLYQIDTFYVEIEYHSERNEITAIKSFISDEPLQPYLEKIDISNIFINK